MSPSFPQPWSLERLQAENLGNAVAWVTPSVLERVRSTLSLSIEDANTTLRSDIDTLVAIGGGSLIDLAKRAARGGARTFRLIAVPTLWGSGAEVSPIIVEQRNGAVVGIRDWKYLPDHWVLWPELAESIPLSRARAACGDAWAHALEGFLSPLATPEVRRELGSTIHELLDLPIALDARWFLPSARACFGQAQAGVGLVHGIAHQLEGALHDQEKREQWHHARLCSAFLLPVMSFNRERSEKFRSRLSEYRIDENRVFAKLSEIFVEADFSFAAAYVESFWKNILRDPCTRTNSCLVRPQDLAFFRNWKRG